MSFSGELLWETEHIGANCFENPIVSADDSVFIRFVFSFSSVVCIFLRSDCLLSSAVAMMANCTCWMAAAAQSGTLSM